MGKVSKGFFWSAVDQFSFQGVSFILSIIIARLVSPSAFGVVVMVQVFMSFAQLFIDGGFKSALIQKKDRTDEDFYTVFIFNMVVALILYVIMFVVAPFIADFYDEPQLTSLTRVIALNLIFASLSITQLVRLQLDLNFKTQAKARLISVIISGLIGIICAYRGMEVWALVIQSIINSLLTSLFLMVFSRWMPRFIFSIKSFKHLFPFGFKILFSDFLTNSYIQLTNLIIGKFYSSSELAYYNRGWNISQLPTTSIMNIITRTVIPILSFMQDDMNSLIYSYRKYLRLSCLIIFPLSALLAILAHPIIIILLTDKWEPTASLLSIFCIVFMFYPFINNAATVTTVLGYGNLIMKSTIVRRSVGLIILFITLMISVKAVAIGLVINNFFESIVCMWYCQKCTGESVIKQFFYVKDIFIITLLMAAITYLVMIIFSSQWAQLLIAVTIGMTVYLSSIFLFKLEESEMIIEYFKKFKSYYKR